MRVPYYFCPVMLLCLYYSLLQMCISSLNAHHRDYLFEKPFLVRHNYVMFWLERLCSEMHWPFHKTSIQANISFSENLLFIASQPLRSIALRLIIVIRTIHISVSYENIEVIPILQKSSKI